MGKKAALHNLGCKVNAYETEAMRQLLEKAGYEIVPFAPGADVYVINTCSVTNIADRKSRQMLHRARKMNPQAIVVAVGCYVETAQTPAEEDPAVDIVLGNNRKGELLEALRLFEEARSGQETCQPLPENTEETRQKSPRQLPEGTDETRQKTCQELPEDTDETRQKTCQALSEGMDETRQRTGQPLPEDTKDRACRLALQDMKMESSLPLPQDAEKTRPETGLRPSGTAKPDIAGSGRVVTKRADMKHTREYEPLSIARTEEHTRAYLKVQDGCNQFCSYCIIPYARGRVRSRGKEDVLREVEQLAQSGCQEIVLTGIHLSSWGKDHGASLPDLIQAVHGVDGIARIRLGSLEPGIVTEDFAQTLAALPKVCPHFHLSLQSGCTATLKRMNRRYTAEEFEEKCLILRNAFDRPALTTDVIAGFPGETEEEFAETLAFLERIHLFETHIFKYSRRQGTRAAIMPNQVPESEKAARSDRLIALGEINRSRYEKESAGRTTEVLFEEQETIAGRAYYVGYTREYVRAAIAADRSYANKIVRGTLGEEIAPHVFLLQAEKN